jgi:hypothetical protein
MERVRRFLIHIFERCNVNWFKAIPSLSLLPELMLNLLRGTDKEKQPMINDEGVMLLYQTLLRNIENFKR